MNVWAVVWAGTPRDGREVAAEILRGIEGDRAVPGELLVIGPEHRNHDHHVGGTIPELIVDDLDGAIRELAATGVEIVAAPRDGAARTWVHARARDGRMFGLTTGCAACRCAAVASCATA